MTRFNLVASCSEARKIDMTKAANVEGPFKPRLSGSEVKAKVTTEAARSIIKGEAAAREEKTKRLRAARLAKEAMEQLSPEPFAEKSRKRTGERARSRT